MRNKLQLILTTIVLVIFSSCTKSRKAELSEDLQVDVYAISEFGDVSENSLYEAKLNLTEVNKESKNPLQVMNTGENSILSGKDINVPERLKFMFDQLPLNSLNSKQFKVTFTVDKEYVTAYKISKNTSDLTPLEKSIAISLKEAELLAKAKNQSSAVSKTMNEEKKAAIVEKTEILSGRKSATLLIPLFKYKISSVGILARTRNDLREETAKLELKKTEWKDATHIQLTSRTDDRLLIGNSAEQVKELKQLFSEEKLNNQVMSSEELQSRLSVDMKFIDNNTKVFTRLGSDSLYVYEITSASKLNENQLRLLNNKAGNEHVLSCSETSVAPAIRSKEENCVLLLVATLPVTYKKAQLEKTDESGRTSPKIIFEDTQKINSTGLVQIKENVAAQQIEITSSGKLDPNSTVKLSDIKGEFFYRRTFEAASNMFLGRTGTSGDMTIIRFELEDDRIVVRNQQSLIAYTGQGPKDREELMSFPVQYLRISNTDPHGNKLTIPAPVPATKENAEYAKIDWTKNTIPDSNSPLAFYAGGDCFYKNSSLSVEDTDMRLEKDGILNYSLSGSYTVKPTNECVAKKDVNSAYWAGSYQFNFNITERISFIKHKDLSSDVQFAKNISSLAQAAFNFGVFTLADKVTGNGTLPNREGSEKYMPLIHDFRNGKKIKYYLGGINNPIATPPERRQLLIEATKQVIDEWNKTLRYAFKNTSLARSGDYVELIIDGENSSDRLGHLGDLDRNYIWLQELPAENGLLGVAQPAANPRSGTIQAANVIIYTGNTLDQTERLLKMTELYRQYENDIAQIKKDAKMELDASKKSEITSEENKTATANTPTRTNNVNPALVSNIKNAISDLDTKLNNSIKALQLETPKTKTTLQVAQSITDSDELKNIFNPDYFKKESKGQIINYPVNEQTFLKKLSDIASQTNASNDPDRFELEVHKAFIQYGTGDENTQLSERIKQALSKRAQLLDAAIRFNENTKNRPGCFSYARNDINDSALTLDPDPKKNLMLNFKKNVMSTLSHELGHAFGLLHNFKASIDKQNYEFGGEKTGRNYSSIMDYISDIDMNYQGPGPYDAHALRAAYTGMLELEGSEQLVSIDSVVKSLNLPLVHFTKDTLNQKDQIANLGTLKYFEQCDDNGTTESVLCARFDTGGSASEIVKNLIANYHRGYMSRNFVFDKIVFDWSQKVQLINRNITLFQNIRLFLDQAIMSLQLGTGLPEDRSRAVIADQLQAAKLGYIFFQELLRTPDAPETPIMLSVTNSDQTTKYNTNLDRFSVVPYKYKNFLGAEIEDVKIIEARPLFDVHLDNTRDKINSMGILYDKIFALQFLLQSTSVQMNNDTNNSQISYIDFEQFLMGIKSPAQSPTMTTILNLFRNKLTVGFFAQDDNEIKSKLTENEFNIEVAKLQKLNFIGINENVSASKQLSDRTAAGVIIGLAQSKWRSFDAFAESFKISSAHANQSPSDRLNVAKLKQDKSLSDTIVLFAPQNSIGSKQLVTEAARNEFFIINKEQIIKKAFVEIYKADVVYKNSIFKIKQAACAENQEDPACLAAIKKEDVDYLKENPSIAAEKATADLIVQNFVKQLRSLNNFNLIIETEKDKPESAQNLENQVMISREIIFAQLSKIMQIKKILEEAPLESIEVARNTVIEELTEIRKKMAKLENLPLIATAFSSIADFSRNITISLKNGEKLTGAAIANAAMNTQKIQTDLNEQLTILEKLAKYSNLVDPDTNLR